MIDCGRSRLGKQKATIHPILNDSLPFLEERAGDWDAEVRGKANLSATLNDGRNEAILYRKLSTLRCDVPIPHTLEDLRWTGARRDLVETVVAQLENPGLLERTIQYA